MKNDIEWKFPNAIVSCEWLAENIIKDYWP
jgi:hypothetical protein